MLLNGVFVDLIGTVVFDDVRVAVEPPALFGVCVSRDRAWSTLVFADLGYVFLSR